MVVGHIGRREVHHERVVAGNLSLGMVGIDPYALAEEFGVGRGVVEQEVEHDDVGCHLYQMAGAKVVVGGVGGFLHPCNGFLELVGHEVGTLCDTCNCVVPS